MRRGGKIIPYITAMDRRTINYAGEEKKLLRRIYGMVNVRCEKFSIKFDQTNPPSLKLRRVK